ncbi:MAG: DUF898 domain-containing protein [Deltaproteobacteria bacterium]|nr:DUF898 domain-containing protein [Deltaproteobacteria bacterium]
MSDTLYNVIYRGKVLKDFDVETAKRNLIKMFSLSEKKAEKVLMSRRVVLKKNVDESTAKKYGIALKKAGLDVALTKNPPRVVSQEATTAPGLKKVASYNEKRKDASPPPENLIERKAGVPASTVVIKRSSRIPFEFHGTGSEYFKIWIVNIILSIVTLGIYSPWAKVRRKQYFYGNTHLKEASFEYLADPVKILKGRAIVVGLFIVHSILSNLVPIIGGIIGLAILFILPWLVVRSLAFNAGNSAIRNIRFGFDGNVGEAAKVYVLWPILAAFTMGILFPYVYFRQKKFVVENSSYGTTGFTFTATAGEYYRLVSIALIPIVISIVIGIVFVVACSYFFPPAASLVGLVLYIYLFAFFSVKTTNLFYNSSRLAFHRLESTQKIKEYIVIVATNSVAIALTLGLFYPWAKVRTLRYKLEHLTMVASGNLDSFIAKEQKQVSAVGEEMSDFLDFDFGL